MASTTLIGRTFENHSLKFLNHHLHMALRRVGGANDEGIDLRGWWYVPDGARRSVPVDWDSSDKSAQRNMTMKRWDGMVSPEPIPGMGGKDIYEPGKGWRLHDPLRMEYGDVDEGSSSAGGSGSVEAGGQTGKVRRLRVLGQCKAEKKPLSGRMVREMEGVLAHFHGRDMQAGPHQYTLEGRRRDISPPETVGILISQSGFSFNATTRAWRSPAPLMLVHLPGGRPHFGVNGDGRSPYADIDGEGEAGRGMRVNGCWWNPALSSLKGLFGGTMELRREIFRDNPLALGPEEQEDDWKKEAAVGDQWRVWYKGEPLGRVGPSLDEALSKLGVRRDSD